MKSAVTKNNQLYMVTITRETDRFQISGYTNLTDDEEYKFMDEYEN